MLSDDERRLHDRIAELEAELAQARDDAYVISLRSISQGAVVEAAKAWRELVRDRGTVYALDTVASDLIAAVDALSTSQRDRQEASDGA